MKGTDFCYLTHGFRLLHVVEFVTLSDFVFSKLRRIMTFHKRTQNICCCKAHALKFISCITRLLFNTVEIKLLTNVLLHLCNILQTFTEHSRCFVVGVVCLLVFRPLVSELVSFFEYKLFNSDSEAMLLS